MFINITIFERNYDKLQSAILTVLLIKKHIGRR